MPGFAPQPNALTGPEGPDNPVTDTVNQVLGGIGDTVREGWNALAGSPDQWTLATQKAQAGDSTMLRALGSAPFKGAVSPQPKDEPALDTPEHLAWFKDQAVSGALQMVNADTLAGENALTAPKWKLGGAKVMESMGKDPTGVWQKAGWERGADGLWRFEIPDDKADWDPETPYMGVLARHLGQPVQTPEGPRIVTGAEDLLKSGVSGPVGHFLGHEDLFAAYPQLKSMRLNVRPDSQMAGFKGAFNPPGARGTAPSIDIATSTAFGPDGKSTMLHELQHAVQHIEGFAPGGNTSGTLDDLANRAEAHYNNIVTKYGDGTPQAIQAGNDWQNIVDAKNDPEKAYEIYRRLAGETEARNVQYRSTLGPITRSQFSPNKTASYPPEGQIVLPGGRTATAVAHDPFQTTVTPVDHDPFQQE